MNLMEKIVVGAIAFILTAVIVSVVLDAGIKADCLRQGFPKHAMNWKFDGYCLGYDGAIHPVVKPSYR